jgi:hypothetical protein
MRSFALLLLSTIAVISALVSFVMGQSRVPATNANNRAHAAQRQWESSRAKQLSLREQMDVLKSLDVADKMDKRQVSIRWTGRLKAPADGTYTFDQVSSLSGSSRVRLWLNEVLVLDSVSADKASPSYQSQPVSLTSGKPVNFRMDFVHHSASPGNFPVAILTWKSDVLDKQIIPATAFLRPDGRNAGLRGEYFVDANWGRRVSERVDEAVDFIWDRAPVENGFFTTRREIVKSCLSRLMNPAFLATMEANEAEIYAKEYIPYLIAGMSASERMAFVDALTRQPNLLRGMPLTDLALPLQTLDLLDEEKHVSFLLAWAGVNPQMRSVPGSYIQGFGSYVTANVEPFSRIARACRKIEFAETLDVSCILPSGECNLTLIYVLINVGKSNGKIVDVLKKINTILADKEIQGNTRMTWLLAKAYAKEVGISQITRPGRGLPELREAFSAAESAEYRFWALQELVARLVTIGSSDEARSLIDSVKNQFPEQEKQEAMTRWLATGEDLARQYQSQQRQSRNRSLTNLSTELNRRGDQMMRTGNMDAARELKNRAAHVVAPANR